MKALGMWRLEMPRPGELRWISHAGLAYTAYPEPGSDLSVCPIRATKGPA